MSKVKKFKISLVVFAIIIWVLTILVLLPGADIPLWRKFLACAMAGVMYGSCVWLGFRVVRGVKDE